MQSYCKEATDETILDKETLKLENEINKLKEIIKERVPIEKELEDQSVNGMVIKHRFSTVNQNN